MDWSPLSSWFSTHGWRFLLIIVCAVVAALLLQHFIPPVISRIVERQMADYPREDREKRAHTLNRTLTGTGKGLIALIAVFALLGEAGVNITAALAGLGVVGIAVGFGAQTIIRDLIAGFFILMENQYHVGDVVKVGDIAGMVEDINLRRTVLRDLDGVVHYVPNGEIKIASNFTQKYSRVNMNISVAYGEDLDRVIAVINRVGKELAEDPRWTEAILKPPQVLRVDSFGDSGIEIKILGDTLPLRQWEVMGELRLRLKKAFDQEGIEIPWPHTKVYFGNQLPITKD